MRKHDAIILGGGLAGLTLALHLRAEFADLDILVLERRAHPLPDAAHKVGESSVEIAAHYFDHTLGLKQHLDAAHLRKFGLRYFFSEYAEDIEQVSEIGVSHELPTPSYQIDRGVFETFLGAEARRRGIQFRDSTRVTSFDVNTGEEDHRVRFQDADGEHEAAARWLLDASGRVGLLRRRFDLTRDNGHAVNAVWFRLNTRLRIDDWGSESWRAQCQPPERWRSTNHLLGPGYWAWLIPLGSGAHSIGIVADAAMHPLEDMRDFDRALAWLEKYQPTLARAVRAERESLLDFAFLRHYSYGCKQVFSADRWALTGEAGLFTDPLYSPGSDFIAINNTYIAALIGHDRAGRNLGAYTQIYERLYFSFYESTLSLYKHQYALLGNAEVMPIKVIWDYAYYWGVLCQLIFQQRLTDTALLGSVRDDLERAQALNIRMQGLFRAWHAAANSTRPAGMLDQSKLDWFAALNASLHDSIDDAALIARLGENVKLLDGLADAISTRAALADPSLQAPLSGQPMPLLFEAA